MASRSAGERALRDRRRPDSGNLIDKIEKARESIPIRIRAYTMISHVNSTANEPKIVAKI